MKICPSNKYFLKKFQKRKKFWVLKWSELLKFLIIINKSIEHFVICTTEYYQVFNIIKTKKLVWEVLGFFLEFIRNKHFCDNGHFYEEILYKNSVLYAKNRRKVVF
jgi:hypothetical protein